MSQPPGVSTGPGRLALTVQGVAGKSPQGPRRRLSPAPARHWPIVSGLATALSTSIFLAYINKCL